VVSFRKFSKPLRQFVSRIIMVSICLRLIWSANIVILSLIVSEYFLLGPLLVKREPFIGALTAVLVTGFSIESGSLESSLEPPVE